MAKRGIYGGSFNPPHHGHIICAQEARIQFGLDEVVFVPTGESSDQAGGGNGDPGREGRFELCGAAVAGQPQLTVSRIETDRPGVSFTVDTLQELKAERPSDELVLIIGGDQALKLAGWAKPEQLPRFATIAVAKRGGSDAKAICDAVTAATDGHCPEILEMPRVDIASSDIRAHVAAGRSITHLVPAAVAAMIAKQNYYVASAETAA